MLIEIARNEGKHAVSVPLDTIVRLVGDGPIQYEMVEGGEHITDYLQGATDIMVFIDNYGQWDVMVETKFKTVIRIHCDYEESVICLACEAYPEKSWSAYLYGSINDLLQSDDG